MGGPDQSHTRHSTARIRGRPGAATTRRAAPTSRRPNPAPRSLRPPQPSAAQPPRRRCRRRLHHARRCRRRHRCRRPPALTLCSLGAVCRPFPPHEQEERTAVPLLVFRRAIHGNQSSCSCECKVTRRNPRDGLGARSLSERHARPVPDRPPPLHWGGVERRQTLPSRRQYSPSQTLQPECPDVEVNARVATHFGFATAPARLDGKAGMAALGAAPPPAASRTGRDHG